MNDYFSFFTGNFKALKSSVRYIFRSLFQKMLRIAYLRAAVEDGKIFKLNNYVEQKKYLLYLHYILKEWPII